MTVGTVGTYRVKFTKHALTRIGEMGVTPEEIKAVIQFPSHKSPSNKYETTNWTRGRLTLSVIEGEAGGDFDLHVITCLWADAESWERDYQENPIRPEGRECRDLSQGLRNAALRAATG